MDRELIRLWKPRLHALDPWRAIAPEELEALYAERPNAPSSKLSEELLLQSDPAAAKIIFCGARGSGKTTELTRIGRLLQPDFAVVRVDVQPALANGAGTLAILAILGLAGLHAAHLWTAPDAELTWPPRPPLLKRAAEHFAERLGQFADISGALGRWFQAVGPVVMLFEPVSGAALTVSGTSLTQTEGHSQKINEAAARLIDVGRSKLGDRVQPDQAQDAEELVGAINAILTALEEAAGRPPLILIDGLDRLDSLEDVQRALGDADLLQRLRAPLVFSGPIQLRHHEQFNGLPGRFRPEVLHNLPVLVQDGAASAEGPGIETLLRAYQNRAAAFSLPSDLIPESELRRVARFSAGIIREFFLLLYDAGRAAMRRGADQINSGDIDFAIQQRRHFLQLALTDTRITLLQRVLERRVQPAGADGEQLLFENYIACYPNGDLWYRPHELLVEYLQGLRQNGSASR